MKSRFRKSPILYFITSILFIAVWSLFISSLFGVSCLFIFAFLFAASVYLPNPKSALMETFYRQAWEREAIKKMQSENNNSFRVGIRDLSKYLNKLNDGETVVINLAYFGVTPDVLINNTTYPIAVQQLDADTVVVTVHKFQTKATPITDDELYGLAYDKINTASSAHMDEISNQTHGMAIHSVCPNANTTATPILLTTGDLVNGRRMMRFADLTTFKRAIDKNKNPSKGRRLVLCNDHLNDLFDQSETFKDQYYDSTEGKLYKRMKFEFWESDANPFINVVTKQKLSYGGVVTSNHTEASVFFCVSRVVQASGFMKMYKSISDEDPLNQRNLINFRYYDILMPYKQEAIGAIASAIS